MSVPTVWRFMILWVALSAVAGVGLGTVVAFYGRLPWGQTVLSIAGLYLLWGAWSRWMFREK